MTVRTVEMPPSLFESDETAWLEAMSEWALNGKVDELDLPHLAEYLSDMAGRDRREVESRLVALIAHILKWDVQRDRRSRSWRGTVVEQRQELNRLVRRGVLRHHADKVLEEAYSEAVERAAAETGLPPSRFSVECPFTIDQLLAFELPSEDV